LQSKISTRRGVESTDDRITAIVDPSLTSSLDDFARIISLAGLDGTRQAIPA